MSQTQQGSWYEGLARAWGEPAAQARFKQEIEDFQVEELVNWQCSGAGEHLCLYVAKQGMTTPEVVRRLAAAAAISPRQISYAGLKDRQGLCRQWFSLHLPGRPDPDLSNIEGPLLRIERASRHHRKIRIGSHAANRFSIRLRQLDGDEGAVGARLLRIAEEGVPNYFAEQRFGHGEGNITAVHNWFEGGTRPRDHKLRSLLLSTARAVVFNEVLSRRVGEGSWNKILDGEMVSLQGSDRCFAAEMGDTALISRLQQLDIHPSGPLWGRGEPDSQGAVRRFELAVAQQHAALCRGLAARGLSHARRSLRLWPQQLHYARLSSADWLLQFSLPPGAYATAVLRELCHYRQTSASEAEQS